MWLQKEEQEKTLIQNIKMSERTHICIPLNIWQFKLNGDLTMMETHFLAEIDQLDNGKKGCYASNSHFMELFGISKSRCSDIISNLKRKNFISVDDIRKGVPHRKRMIRVERSSGKSEQSSSENPNTPFANSKQRSFEKQNTKDGINGIQSATGKEDTKNMNRSKSNKEKVNNKKDNDKKLKKIAEKYKITIKKFWSYLNEHHPHTYRQLKESEKRTNRNWLETLEKLERLDRYKKNEIDHAIDNAVSDEFWSKQLRSIKKLRRKNKDGIKYIAIFLELKNKKIRTRRPGR